VKSMTLSKSLFAVALECPRQLDYVRDPSYYDSCSDNELIASLAEGGHQVGELARRMFPGGILVSDESADSQARRTAELLSLSEVVIFEATIQYENLLIRADVLQKKGNQIGLFEVKAKGFDPNKDSFLTTLGSPPVRSQWQSYLYDVAFQTYVLRLAYPGFVVTPHLMLLDKTVVVMVDGLNPMLAVQTGGRQVTVTVDPAFDVGKIKPPILRPIQVAKEVTLLLDHPLEVRGLRKSFPEFVDWASGILGAGASFPVEVGSQCKACSFYVDPAEATPVQKSGWAVCMQAHFGAMTLPRRSDTVYGLYRASAKSVDALLRSGYLALGTLPESALGDVEGSHEVIPLDRRRQLQVAEAHGEINAPVVLAECLKKAMAGWRWPLHFIDFETTRPALPYHRGRAPYDQILFQFSHHVLMADGKLEHRTQCLEASPGVPPSVGVLRSLRDALAGDDGTVVHWWTHEATVLKDIQRQMEKDVAADRASFSAFIHSLVGTKEAPGRLVDLGMLVSKLAFFPGTAGSSSIKKVLPAALQHSAALRRRYEAPVYGTPELPSLNFRDWVWVREEQGAIQDPYALLSPLFANPELQAAVRDAEMDGNGEADGFIANGGAAIIAYDQLQQTTLPAGERTRIEMALLRYCELDTLAMVMVYQALTGDGI
jgi:Domain of unknown function(DUF2779)